MKTGYPHWSTSNVLMVGSRFQGTSPYFGKNESECVRVLDYCIWITYIYWAPAAYSFVEEHSTVVHFSAVFLLKGQNLYYSWAIAMPSGHHIFTNGCCTTQTCKREIYTMGSEHGDLSHVFTFDPNSWQIGCLQISKHDTVASRNSSRDWNQVRVQGMIRASRQIVCPLTPPVRSHGTACLMM